MDCDSRAAYDFDHYDNDNASRRAGMLGIQLASERRWSQGGDGTCRLLGYGDERRPIAMPPGGYPVLIGVYSASKRSKINAGHGGPEELVPTDLSPAAQGYLSLWGSDWCTSPQKVRFRSIVVELPDNGGSFIVTNHLPCSPISETQLGVPPPPVPEYVPPPGTLQSLQARTLAPARVQTGRVFAYVVTLTNTGSKTVSLMPCPGYTESLSLYVSGRWQWERRSYELNCSSVRRLLAGQSRASAMRIRVPAHAQPGLAKLAWWLDIGNGPLNGRVVTVTP